MASSTIKLALDKHKNIGPGFDLLRLGLACAIFIGHARWIAVGLPAGHIFDPQGLEPVQDFNWSLFGSLRRAEHLALVPMFFALSGFLVTGSAMRVKSLKPFLAFRILRIVPALTVEVTLSALLLGSVFTTLPLNIYFTDHEFFRYFGNIFGFITFHLPGVFTNNPVAGTVNGNLWTLPGEFYCYLITSALIITGLLFNRTIFLTTLVVGTAAFLASSLFFGFGAPVGGHYPTIVATYYFFVGSAFYQYREFVPLNWAYFCVAAAAAVAALAFPLGVFVAPVFLTYATIFIGTMSWPKLPLIQNGDYSYGIYLYGYPILQATLAAAPGLHGHKLWVGLIGGAITVAFAVTSWHLIEVRILAFKKHFSQRTIPQSPEARATS